VKTYSLLEYTFLTFIFSELSEVSRTKNVDTFYIKDSITDISDVNSDNASDIVAASYGSTSMSVHLNAGNGTFLSQTPYVAGANPRSVSVADVNSDNQSDIIVANAGSNNVGVLLHY
jgi:hypothetical protein